MSWVYILGEVSGEDVKIGRTSEKDLRKRLKAVNNEQTTSCQYRILVGVRGTAKDERALKDHFAEYVRTDKGARTEYFWPADDLVEYANWLRSRYWATLDGSEKSDDLPMEGAEHWLPDGNGRSTPRPLPDPHKLVQDYEDLQGPLAGTAWAWMVTARTGIKDYFTPPWLIEAAREAMGGIDLDAASHWLANREHKIPDWFHTGRSAFDNEWHGKVWLNPPYGNNAPWFERILEFYPSGPIEQLCMLSPVWAFTTKPAAEFMRFASGTVLLIPTPKFWGNVDPDKTGKNHPHMIVYLGPSQDRFFSAFSQYGLPFEAAWDQIPELVDGGVRDEP